MNERKLTKEKIVKKRDNLQISPLGEFTLLTFSTDLAKASGVYEHRRGRCEIRRTHRKMQMNKTQQSSPCRDVGRNCSYATAFESVSE